MRFSQDKLKNFSDLYNLPIVKKIKILPFQKTENQFREEVLNSLKSEKIISHEEVLTLLPQTKLNSLKGYLSQTKLYNFLISEIEYEDYNSLRSHINLADRNSNKILNSKLDSIPCLNSFLIPKKSYGNVTIEFIDHEKTFSLPRNIMNFMNNYYLRNFPDYRILDSDFFKSHYKNIKSRIENSETIFLIGPSSCGSNYLCKIIADQIGLSFIKKDASKFNSIQKLITFIKKCEFRFPCLINFTNSKKISHLLKNNENSLGNNLTELKEILKMPRLNDVKHKLSFIFSFESSSDVDQNLNPIADAIYEIQLPNMKERISLFNLALNNTLLYPDKIFSENFGLKIKTILKAADISYHLERHNILFEVGKLTVGYNIKEIQDSITFLVEEFYNKHEFFFENQFKENNSTETLSKFDKTFIRAVFYKLKQSRLKSEKTISSIPEVKWEDVGGLETAKEDINDTIQLPLKYPKLFESIILFLFLDSLKRRSGLLLYGPPGSGKTLLAKAIANECSMNFISVKGPELLNMYVGESEKNIRDVFERARSNRPCALFFDEIDAIAPARTKNSDQNNVMDRIVAQFMTEMDGLTKENDLIVIASTNRPDLVDASLLRPGRFDKMIYVGLPRSIEEKTKIFQAQTLKLNLQSDIDCSELAKISKEDYSGADIYAVCSTAFTLALKEFLKNNDNNQINETPQVSLEHFKMAIDKISPSLPKDEIKKYEDIKNKYSLKK
jgi:SpoVK/Ycf46/Vps4 family AAA+-type ATPase